MNVEELFAQAHIVEQQIVELQPLQAEGLILDIGGGGEGIIGKRAHLNVLGKRI